MEFLEVISIDGRKFLIPLIEIISVYEEDIIEDDGPKRVVRIDYGKRSQSYSWIRVKDKVEDIKKQLKKPFSTLI